MSEKNGQIIKIETEDKAFGPMHKVDMGDKFPWTCFDLNGAKEGDYIRGEIVTKGKYKNLIVHEVVGEVKETKPTAKTSPSNAPLDPNSAIFKARTFAISYVKDMMVGNVIPVEEFDKWVELFEGYMLTGKLESPIETTTTEDF